MRRVDDKLVTMMGERQEAGAPHPPMLAPAHHSAWRQVLVACLALAGPWVGRLPALPQASADVVDEERGADDVAQVLLDCRATTGGALQLSERLHALGVESLPRRLSILADRRFQVRVGERGNSARPVSQGERAALITAFGRAPWDAVQALLHERLELGPDEGERIAALQIIGAFGGSSQIVDLMHWSEPAETQARVPHAVRENLTEGISLLLAHHPEASSALPGLFEHANPSLLLAVLEALRSRPSSATLETLVEILGRVPAVDPYVLTEISHVALHVRRPVDPDLRQSVREYLDFPHDRERQLEAIIAVRNLEDESALPILIDLLSADDALLRERAYDTLKQLTNRHHAPQQERWRDWYENADRWWREDSRNEFETVRNGPAGEAARIVLELSKRTLFRHAVAEGLGPALQRDEEELVSLICASLGHLRSPLAVPALLQALSEGSVTVRRAAYLALTRITGEDHGEEAQLWREAGW